MSGIFGQVKRSARRASFEAERMVRVERVQGQIGALNTQLRTAITRLGHLTYELAQRNEIEHVELRQFCAGLDELQARIATHEAEIEAIRKETAAEDEETAVYCTRCGAGCTPSMRFCVRCGNLLHPTGMGATSTGGACPRCLGANPQGALACVQCGYALSAPPMPSASVPSTPLPPMPSTPPAPPLSQRAGQRMLSAVGVTAPSMLQAGMPDGSG